MNNDIIDLFKHSYQDMTLMDLSKLDRIYSDTILFKDPVHEVRGLVALQDYLADVSSNIDECRFEFLDEMLSESGAYLKWNMHFRHPKLASGKLLSVRGVSQIHFGERIFYHEDIYDMGAMVYEHVPIVGGLTRWLKGRLAT
jgi:esterase/lipase superfamily enzyme